MKAQTPLIAGQNQESVTSTSGTASRSLLVFKPNYTALRNT